MARLTPQEAAEKQNRRLKASLSDMQRGIERVTESPTQKAAAKKDKMKANLNAAVDSGKWEAGLRRVSTEDWKKQAVEVGLGRVAAGIDAAQNKVTQFYSELLPFQDNIRAQLKSMPDNTLEDGIARATKYMRDMAKFRSKK